MDASVWTIPLVLSVLTALCAVSRRLFRARLARSAAAPLSEEERRIYQRWNLGGGLLFAILAPLLGYVWYLPFTGAAGVFPHATPATRYLVEPTWLFWAIPAAYLGMLSSSFPIDWLFRRLLRKRYSRFERFEVECIGFDGKHLMLGFGILGIVGSALFFVGGVTTFARFEEAGVEIGKPLAVRSKFYGYARVKAVEHRATFRAPAGNSVQCSHHAIVFDDGSTWSTRDVVRLPDPDLDERIIKFVVERSGRAIDERP
jgi:hypothetical protein